MSSSIIVTLVKFPWLKRASTAFSNDLSILHNTRKQHRYNVSKLKKISYSFDSVSTTVGGHSSMSSSICTVFSVIFKIMSYAAKSCILTMITSLSDRVESIVEFDSSEAVCFSIVDTTIILSIFWSAVSVVLITRSERLYDTATTLSIVTFT